MMLTNFNGNELVDQILNNILFPYEYHTVSIMEIQYFASNFVFYYN